MNRCSASKSDEGASKSDGRASKSDDGASKSDDGASKSDDGASKSDDGASKSDDGASKSVAERPNRLRRIGIGCGEAKSDADEVIRSPEESYLVPRTSYLLTPVHDVPASLSSATLQTRAKPPR